MDAKSKQETRANSAGNNSLQSSKKNTQENDANKSSSVDLKSRPEQLLKRARLCFQGDECWDEKEALISKIEEYLSKQNDTTGKSEHQLKAYSEYFQTTGTLESVPIEGTLANDCGAFQRAVDALGKMPKITVVLGAAGETIDNMSKFIENEKFDTKVFFVAKNSSKFRQEKPMDMKKMSILEENGLTFHSTIARNSVDLLRIDCDHISINKIGPVWNDLVEYLLTENAAILLTNLNEHHLAFLTEVAGCFDIISKQDNIRLYRRRLVMKMTTDTPYEEVQELWNTPLPRKLRFEENPDWEHHHKNAFTSSIDALRNKLGNDNAEVLFIPAVEQFMCDSQATPVQPWIGIIHGVIDSNEHFYVPDLRKLCTQQRYQPWLRQCRGLITLTTDQAQFLKANLQDKYGMPIVSVKYPFTAIERSLTATKSTAAEIWKSTGSVDVYFIGSFDRDFQHFFQAQLPDGARKALLLGDWRAQLITIPDDVIRAERATDDEYERILSESVVFLSLKQGGAANTTVLECIARNTPIIAPRVASVEEYLGKDYPLFYEQGALDFQHILTPDRIEKAATYLRSMDKTSLAADHFIDSIEKSTVLASLAPYKTDARQFTITIAICSYKRTHHLRNILDSLWNKQTYQGNYEIIVWNNNRNRQKTVADICGEFMTKNCPQKQLELIQSSENHYCAVRFAMPQLMRSERLLICDDDVVPGSDFIQFFIDAHHRHPTDVLCIRGQYFLPHKMNDIDPHQVWITYDHVRFVDDQAEERLIHYVHADVCLIPKLALHEIASIPLPHDDFKLVDDYWMSYVLSAQFERRLRKLKIAENVLERMSDSDEIGLALHTRPEVSNARTRVYIEHMCHGWPQFDRPQPYYDAALAAHKKRAWDKYRLGMNVNSEITDSDIVVLKELGVGFVRVGAVGVGRDQSFEFSELNADYKQQMVQTSSLIERLARNGIDVVIVLDRRLATAENWRRLADCCAKFKNVIGYDLINEPFTDQNNDQHWYEMKPLEPDDQEKLFEMYRTLIEGVRSSDLVTPVIIETPFWASISTLDHLPIAKLKQVEANLIVSIHYYEPQLLTWRYQNKNRFAFPGPVPIYDQCGPMSETIDWSHDYIAKRFDLIRSWIKETEVPVFVGEFGICRDTVGADQYLEAVVDSCKRLNLVGCFYAFRDPDWEAMDYELGTDISNEHQRTIKGNHFMELIKNSCANDFASVTKNE
uniref:Glycoside hydrolase family 5 domain-containing protein n=1 Tax=Plectus sambesii TaxID=2011161 RepID=A0A914UQB0_9BILA